MNFLIDSINSQRNIAYTTNIERINYNLELFPQFKDKINEYKIGRDSVSLVAVKGRWILVYLANSKDDENTTLIFLSFRIDVDSLDSSLFSEGTIANIKHIQSKYDKIFSSSLDTSELTYADINETVLKENLFACDEDIFVLTKASKLGALPVVESLKSGDKVKVVFCDEQLIFNENPIVNAYAFINFNSNRKEGDNGFAYLKIFDLRDNMHLIQDFIRAIEQLGVKFDSAFFMDKFSLDRLN